MGVAILGVEVVLAQRGERLADDVLDLDGRIGGPGASLRIVWLGDSTAAGVGASDTDAALPRRVAAGLRRPVELSVLAVSGARLADVVADQLPAVTEADVVLISVGSNDVTHATGRAAFRRRYRRLLAELPEGATVVALGVPDFGAVPRLAQPLRVLVALRGRQLATDVRNAAEAAGATFVDIAGRTGPSFRDDPGRYFAADDYHPSDAGYRLWADAVLDAAKIRR